MAPLEKYLYQNVNSVNPFPATMTTSLVSFRCASFKKQYTTGMPHIRLDKVDLRYLNRFNKVTNNVNNYYLICVVAFGPKIRYHNQTIGTAPRESRVNLPLHSGSTPGHARKLRLNRKLRRLTPRQRVKD